jgi:hypothetical protein
VSSSSTSYILIQVNVLILLEFVLMEGRTSYFFEISSWITPFPTDENSEFTSAQQCLYGRLHCFMKTKMQEVMAMALNSRAHFNNPGEHALPVFFQNVLDLF